MKRDHRKFAAVGGTSLLLGGAGSALLLALASSPVGATGTTFTVDTLDDGPAQASDCTTPVPSSCSLRDALAAVSTGDAIAFASGLNGTIHLDGDSLGVSRAITVVGPGASSLSIDAGGTSRVFYVCAMSGGAPTISGMTITGGSTSKGGGLYEQGCGGVILREVVITGNAATVRGGGVYSNADLTIIDSTIINNDAGDSGGGVMATGLVSISGSEVGGNQAAGGGGGGIFATRATIENSTIDENRANSCGGGLYLRGDRVTVSVVNSTFVDNSSRACYGGAIDIDGENNTVNISQSTFVGNSAIAGGAIHAAASTTLDIELSTITGNSSTGTGSELYSGGGIHLTPSGSVVTMWGTVVAGNTAASGGIADIAAGYEPMPIDMTLSVDRSMIGLIGPNVTLSGSNNVRGTDPMVGQLTNNGGPTQTMLPLAGSPLIDAGGASGSVPEFDQRGANFLRVQGLRVDIGAVEVQVAPEPTTTTTEAAVPVTPTFTG